MADLHAYALSYNDAPLAEACDTVTAYTHNRLGISHTALVGLVLFFKTEGASEAGGKTTSFSSSSDIPWDVDYSAKTRNWYVIAKDQIANGHNKVLYRALRYNTHGLHLIACAVQDTSMPREGKYFARFGATRGVMRVYDVIHPHSRETHVFCKLYNQGSLGKTLKKANLSLTLYEKEVMCEQILEGLEAIHKTKTIHRDLKSLNLLVHIDVDADSRRITVAITDFGHGIPASRVRGERAQWNGNFYSPEAILFKDLSGEDYYKTDLFAAGCNLYQIFYGHDCPWADRQLVHNDSMSAKKRYSKLLHNLEAATNARRGVLEAKYALHTLTPREEFEYLVLTSVHPDPNKRQTAHDLRVWLEEIMKR